MNDHMCGNFPGVSDYPEWSYASLSYLSIQQPRESGCVFIDTHEDSIATGFFLVAQIAPATAWAHFPASRHNGGATVSFTDGHVVCHRWVDARTRQPVTGKSLYGVVQDGNPDVRWLQERATALRKPVL
jgi:prepilin-type processing-associated H-X9-DG protein